MSLAKIRAALETRLGTLTPALSTAYENAAFSPVSGTPYQRVNLLPAAPDNSVMGASVYFSQGIFQVMLCYPVNGGPGAAQARADLLVNHFKRGTTLVNAPLQIIVMSTPRIAGALIDGDRFCVPVSITYQSQIET